MGRKQKLYNFDCGGDLVLIGSRKSENLIIMMFPTGMVMDKTYVPIKFLGSLLVIIHGYLHTCLLLMNL